jgi:catechol 2,3-dioxygenase-like lactoylglutathione lyase family enzyme
VPHPDPSHEFPREKARRVLHHIAFRLDAAEYEALKKSFEAAGVAVRAGVHPVLKDVRTFYVDDPDGNECEFIAPDAAAPNY